MAPLMCSVEMLSEATGQLRDALLSDADGSSRVHALTQFNLNQIVGCA